jgi:hypothetical protein
MPDEKKPQDDNNDPNFIRKDEPQETKQEEKSEKKESKEEVEEEVVEEKPGFFARLKNKIFPKHTEIRDLDYETGGLEAKEQKESTAKDAWDDRSEEVDKMGSTDTFNTTGVRSFIWNQKRKKLEATKHAKHAVDATEAHKIMQEAGLESKMGYVQRLRTLRQDHSHDKGGGGRGI